MKGSPPIMECAFLGLVSLYVSKIIYAGTLSYVQTLLLSPGGGVLYIFWVRGRAIGKGIDFHDFGIRNGIEFHDFGIRNGINFRNFAIGIGSGMHFRKIGIKSGIYF